MIHTPTLGGETEIVVFEWSTKHGSCDDCGLPAAFQLVTTRPKQVRLCSVCAANTAADGTEIMRIPARR